ncbi:MAG: type IV toxin-antitoxin system AbiEi family antitoxin domain-containing protein [Acidimicrobiales bacterium]
MSHPADSLVCVTTDIPDFRARDVADLAAERHGLVTLDELRALGLAASSVSDRRRVDRLVRLAPRVYLVPELLDDRSELAAACLSSPGAVASHRAAAELWGLDGTDVQVVEVTVPHGVTLRRGLTHRSNDLADFEVVVQDGVPCTDPTRTLIDLGAVVADDVVERALESALRQRLASLAASGGAWRRGPPGAPRSTVAAAGPGPKTKGRTTHRERPGDAVPPVPAGWRRAPPSAPAPGAPARGQMGAPRRRLP